MTGDSSTVIKEHESSSWRKTVVSLERDARGRNQIRVGFYGKGKSGWYLQRAFDLAPSEVVAVSCGLDKALDTLSRQSENQ